LTRGGCLRQSNRSIWSGFRPDVCEGAWQHSSKRVANHSIRYGQNSSTKLGRQARAKALPDHPARPARLRLAAGAPVLGAPLTGGALWTASTRDGQFRSNHGGRQSARLGHMPGLSLAPLPVDTRPMAARLASMIGDPDIPPSISRFLIIKTFRRCGQGRVATFYRAIGPTPPFRW
jgi:hypothetical protein